MQFLTMDRTNISIFRGALQGLIMPLTDLKRTQGRPKAHKGLIRPFGAFEGFWGACKKVEGLQEGFWGACKKFLEGWQEGFWRAGQKVFGGLARRWKACKKVFGGLARKFLEGWLCCFMQLLDLGPFWLDLGPFI